MANNLINPENLSQELLKSVYDAAFFESQIDEHGNLMVKDSSFWVYVIPSKEAARIQFVVVFNHKEGANRGDLLDFANRINREYVMIRATIQDNGTISFDHDISVNGGVTKNALVYTTKRFFNIPMQALDEYGSDLVP